MTRLPTPCLLCLLAAGCVTDHDALARRRPDPRPDVVTMPPEAGPTPPDAPVEASVPDAPAEGSPPPDGPFSITLLHGVVDEVDRVAFCFVPVHDGVRGAPVGPPIPEGGLPYARSTVLTSVPGVEPAADAVLPIVLAGDLSLLSGLDCEAAIERAELLSRPVPEQPPAPGPTSEGGAVDEPGEAGAAGDASADADADAADDAGTDAVSDARAGGGDDDAAAGDATAPPARPPVRTAPLATLPPGTLRPAERYLLAAYGCIGGEAFTHPSETSICGSRYAPRAPTLQPLLVRLSTTVPIAKLGLQFVNASLAVAAADLVAVPIEASTAGDYVIARQVAPGQIAPRLPASDRDAVGLGVNGDEAALRVASGSSSLPAYERPWSSTLEAGGLDQLENGHAYALVLVGPFPSFDAGPWWNRPVVTILEAPR